MNTNANNAEKIFDRSYYAKLLGEIATVISDSENQELIYHSLNTVQWSGILLSSDVRIDDYNNGLSNLKLTVNSLKPSDQNLEVAAFAHEIERAVKNSLQPQDFQSYYLYKQASLIKSSEILADLGKKTGTSNEIIKKAVRIIEEAASEEDGDILSTTLKDADILSFFSLSLPRFFINKISDKLLQEICMYEFKRLSPNAHKFLSKFNFSDVRLKYYINILWKENV